jgi:hypothetical protein
MALTCRYGEGALVAEVEQISSGGRVPAPTGRRQEYLPSSQPGSRLPHFPIVTHHHMAQSSSSKVCTKKLYGIWLWFSLATDMDLLHFTMTCAYMHWIDTLGSYPWIFWFSHDGSNIEVVNLIWTGVMMFSLLLFLTEELLNIGPHQSKRGPPCAHCGIQRQRLLMGWSCSYSCWVMRCTIENSCHVAREDEWNERVLCSKVGLCKWM